MNKYRVAEAQFRAIGLNTRTINALVARDVCTLVDLGKLTERDLSTFIGIGHAARAQLRPYLRSEGPSMEIHTRNRIVTVNLPPGTLTEIDAFALTDPAITSRAEAVRRLVALGLSSLKR